MAVEENCPVYPIVITGTTDALPKQSWVLGFKASIYARVLDPVYPDAPELAGSGSRPRDRAAALRERVRGIMIRELAQLRADVTGSRHASGVPASESRLDGPIP